MQLGLTIPLMRFLQISALPYGDNLYARKFCWDLHRITLQGCACLLAVHCETRYTFTLFDLTFADWDDLKTVFLQGLQASLARAGFSEGAICRYLDGAGEAVFTKTHGRGAVAFLNRAWEDVIKTDYAVNPSKQEQPLLDCAVNAIPCRCAGMEGTAAPLERMRACLLAYSNLRQH